MTWRRSINFILCPSIVSCLVSRTISCHDTSEGYSYSKSILSTLWRHVRFEIMRDNHVLGIISVKKIYIVEFLLGFNLLTWSRFRRRVSLHVILIESPPGFRAEKQNKSPFQMRSLHHQADFQIVLRTLSLPCMVLQCNRAFHDFSSSRSCKTRWKQKDRSIFFHSTDYVFCKSVDFRSVWKWPVVIQTHVFTSTQKSQRIFFSWRYWKRYSFSSLSTLRFVVVPWPIVFAKCTRPLPEFRRILYGTQVVFWSSHSNLQEDTKKKIERQIS